MKPTAERVPDAVAPPPNHPRFPLVDGMRAIAALSVLVVHVGFFAEAYGPSTAGRLLAHLNIGVTIFFVISGFLLYRPFVASRFNGPPRSSVPIYGWRRFLRIYPAYWLLLTVLLVVPSVTAVGGGEWFDHYALLQTLPIFQGNACVQTLLECGAAHTWSLGIELTFYAALPAYALAVGTVARRARGSAWLGGELALLGVLSAASVALLVAGPEGGPSGWIGGTAISYVFWFALGMSVALVSVYTEGRPEPALVGIVRRAPAMPWVAALVLYIAVSMLLPPTPFLFVQGDRLATHLSFGAIALLLMLPAVFGEVGRGLPARLLASPLMAWLGLISYGIFLWHYGIAIVLGEDLGFTALLIATVLGTVACAAASYYLVERPVLRLKNVGRARRTSGRERKVAAEAG